MSFLKSRQYLNADQSKAVAEDSPEAAYLLGLPGDEISAEDAKRYGAQVVDAPPEPEAPNQAVAGGGLTVTFIDWNKKALVEAAKAKGLAAGGTKGELVARLEAYEAEEAAKAAAEAAPADAQDAQDVQGDENS